jgi:hypothetical protein
MFKYKFFILISLLLLSIKIYPLEIDETLTVDLKDLTDINLENNIARERFIEKSFLNQCASEKLDCDLLTKKLTDKKYSADDLMKYHSSFFSEIQMVKVVNKDASADTSKSLNQSIFNIHAKFDLDKFKQSFKEITLDFEELKAKNFFIEPKINLFSNTNWTDLGVSREESFSGAILNSWKGLIQKNLPEYKNQDVKNNALFLKENLNLVHPQSVTLGWNTDIKKVYFDAITKKISFEISAHFVLINTINRNVILSFDFPIQKRELDSSNKKELSSVLASLVFNLLNSQMSKIQSSLTTSNQMNSLEIKLTGMTSLSEIYKAKKAIETALISQKVLISVKKMNTIESVLKLDSVVSDEIKMFALLKTHGPILLDETIVEPNEQKFLYFDNENKSFAIRKKD